MRLVDDTLIIVAEQFLDQDLHLKAGEKLLIYVDSDNTKDTVRALEEAAFRNDISCTVAHLPGGVAHSEKERALEELMDRENFDVLCEASEAYFYPSVAWEKARGKGAGIYAIGALNADAFLRCFGSVNRGAMRDFGNCISEMLKRASTVEITSQSGTRITMLMKAGLIKRSWLKLTRRLNQSVVSVPSGNLQRGKYTFLPGQVCFLGIPSTIEGTAVTHDYVWPPADLGVLDSEVILHITGGDVTEIAGRGREADALRSWLKGRATDVKHFCIGFNPKAQLTGTLGEAERVFGAVTVGMGNYPYHVDAIMTSPTIIIEGKTIEKDGTFVDKDLAELQERIVDCSWAANEELKSG